MCLSNIPEFTQSVGVTRLVGIEYPFGRTLGRPGDAEGQRTVLRALLRAGEEMEDPGTVEHLPQRWHQTPAEARSKLPEPPPIATYLKKHPWHLPRMFTRDIPALPGYVGGE